MRFVVEDGVLKKCNQPIFRTSVTIPETVTVIGRGAFADECPHLKKIYLPERLIAIEDKAFRGCASLTTLVPVHMKNITGAVLPEGLRIIGERAFERCRSLSSVILPSSVKVIGRYAFAGCRSLESFSLPYTVKSLGNHILYECFTAETQNAFYLTVCHRKKQFCLPLFRKELFSCGIDDAVLDLFLRKQFDAAMPARVKSRLLCRMLDSGYLTEAYILSREQSFFRVVICGNDADTLTNLLRAEKVFPKIPADHYEQMIHYANDQQCYEVQLVLMEAMKQYAGHEKAADIPEHFQL